MREKIKRPQMKRPPDEKTTRQKVIKNWTQQIKLGGHTKDNSAISSPFRKEN